MHPRFIVIEFWTGQQRACCSEDDWPILHELLEPGEVDVEGLTALDAVKLNGAQGMALIFVVAHDFHAI